MKPFHSQRGFTLIELIIVIVIMGVIGGMVSIFIKSPIDGYFASARRSAMTDVADTTMRRMSREIRTALPQSVTSDAVKHCLEFIATKTGGRYRGTDVAPTVGTAMVFSAAPALVESGSFHMFGDNSLLPVDQQIVAGDVIVVGNTGQPELNAYLQGNTATVTGVTVLSPTDSNPETTITITPGAFPNSASGSLRFQVIPGGKQSIVSYVCSAGNLHRSVRALDPLGGSVANTCPSDGPILVSGVTDCAFDETKVDNGLALVTMRLRLKDKTEVITLVHEVHMGVSP